MINLLPLILPALLPVVADGVRSIIGYFTNGAGAKPQNVDEAIKLMTAEVEKLRAIAQLDAPAGNISRWVADLRASFRYIAAGMILVGTFGMFAAQAIGANIPASSLDLALQMSGSVFSFMFGDRVYMHLSQRKA